MSGTDDSPAAPWEVAGGAAAADSGGQARVLNQAEIDSLLGFDDGPSTEDNRSGIHRIISSGLVSYERLPMLEIVFDRLVRIMSTSLRNFTSDNVDVSIDNILSLRFGDYLNSIPLPAMLAVFKAEEWDNYGLMVVDSAMIYSIVDVLLGGRRGTAASCFRAGSRGRVVSRMATILRSGDPRTARFRSFIYCCPVTNDRGRQTIFNNRISP